MKTKIKVLETNEEILEVQTHESHVLVAGEGERVEDYEGDERPVAGMILEEKNKVRTKKANELPETPQDKRADLRQTIKTDPTIENIAKAVRFLLGDVEE